MARLPNLKQVDLLEINFYKNYIMMIESFSRHDPSEVIFKSGEGLALIHELEHIFVYKELVEDEDEESVHDMRSFLKHLKKRSDEGDEMGIIICEL